MKSARENLHLPCSRRSLLVVVQQYVPTSVLVMIAFLIGAILVLAHSIGTLGVSNSYTVPLRGEKSREFPLEEPARGVHGTVRHLLPVGLAAYTFVLTGGYRTHERGFAVVGLASKPLHVFGKPEFRCQWTPENSGAVHGRARRLLPDWGYGRVYTVVVVHCDFDEPVGEDRTGGKLVLYVGTGETGEPSTPVTAFEEEPGAFNTSHFRPPYRYDYLYCGSSLYGDVNPQRMREWMAYHAKLFGERSHFVFHDVGGVNSDGIKKVLEPWVRLGMVTIHDFREQSRYDGYYYNQFLVVNDCLFRYKHAANWTFFFDVDEYVYVPKPATLESVLDDLGRNYTQVMFEQNLMGHNVCVPESNGHPEQWGFEKLVFVNVQKAVRLDRKYVIKAQLADSAGVHLSEHIKGKSLYSKGQLWYYHFHSTITEHGENCKEFLRVPRDRSRKVWLNKVPYVYDDRLSSMVNEVKEFEREKIGHLVQGL